MAKAHDRAPLGTDANGERHDVMLAERFTCANPVDQESAVAAERRKDQYSLWVRPFDEAPDVQIHTVHEVVVRGAQVPIYD